MKIRLNKPHTHAGQRHDKDAELDVPNTDAAWLIAQGIGEALDSQPSHQSAGAPATPAKAKTTTKGYKA